MKKVLLSCFVALGVTTSAQTVLFEDSFENYTDFAIANVGNWTLRDVDGKTTYGFSGIQFANSGVAKSFQVFNSTTTTPPMTASASSDWTGRTGNKMMVSFAATATPWNNDWMISPSVAIPAGSGAEVSFWGKSCDSEYGDEKFRVYVSTTGTQVADFTALGAVVSSPSDSQWHQYTYDLSQYAGQTIHIAIQCTSQDQFGFAVDDFKVVSMAAQTEAPNCPTLTAPANGNQAVPVNPPATLSWTAASTGGVASSYDVYFGTTPNPTTLLGNVTSTSIPTSALAPLTTYYWKVVSKNNIGSATGCSEFSFKTADANPPGCVTNVTPANGATGVAAPTTPISWTAPTTGGTPTSYDIYWGATESTMTKLGSTANLTVNITGTQFSTTYYWKVVAINADGSATDCPAYSLTTAPSPVAPYCGPLAFTYSEPITKVTFADLTNSSPAATTSPAHEAFLDKIANVTKGETYTMTLEGNTSGNYKARFVVYADWNNDNTFDPTTETYVVQGVLENSTGADGKSVSIDIPVPADAVTGNTRLRIKKTYGANPYVDPCVTGTSFGQAEDYTLKIAGTTPPVTYCEVSLECNDGDLITNVTFAGINNDSACGTNGYSDYSSSVAPASVIAGQTYPISVTVGDGWYERVAGWIDYNNNGIFESSEYLGEIGDGGTGVTTSGTVTIPANTVAGNYRMRLVVTAAGSNNTATDNPCLFEDPDVIFGEYEDYTVAVGTMAVNDINKAKVQVYPNPVVDVLKVNSVSNAKSIKVYDMNGKIVANQAAKATANEVNMSRMTPGTYVVVVETENGADTIKVIKK